MCVPQEDRRPLTDYKTQSSLQVSPVSSSGIKLESFPVEFEGFSYQGWLAFQDNDHIQRPVVLVFPNYAGLKQFDKDQAIFLAQLGYVGLAVDLYKTPYDIRNPSKDAPKEVVAKHVKTAFSEMNRHLRNPKPWRELMGKYLKLARQHPRVHPVYAAAIGYCFGGQCVLELVRGGYQVQGVVSFHGILQSKPNNILKEQGFDSSIDDAGLINNYNKDCHVLIENGELDELVPYPSVVDFQKEMNSNKIHWRFNNHAQTPHGFALAPGVWSSHYTEMADRMSTLSMISLFCEIFPEFPAAAVSINASGTALRHPTAKL
eukprot:Lithocolla_globosa_v1_NODE_1989_length_2226_cov_3.643943.p1 type:complete len:317 gc:universal NODE_1989_length_2226_cov_3.643943:1036-1986(+)